MAFAEGVNLEVFYEQNVGNPQIDKHRKRTTVLSVVSKVLLAVGILVALLLIGSVQVKGGAIGIVIGIVLSLLSAVPFVLSFWLIGRFLRNSNTEYDYVLNGSILRVIRVIRRNKRKLMSTIPIDSIESIGKVSCEAYDRYAGTKGIKKQFAVCNYEDEEAIVYIRYRNEGEDYLLHMEPDEEMVASLRRSLRRISIMDKSMNPVSINPVKKS